jgi:hypothetical protein
MKARFRQLVILTTKAYIFMFLCFGGAEMPRFAAAKEIMV